MATIEYTDNDTITVSGKQAISCRNGVTSNRRHDKLKVEGDNWRRTPGTTIAASSCGTIRPALGKVTIIYNQRFGLYTPLAGTLAPVHLLVAAAWLPYPDHLSGFELSAFLHRLVVHKDGVNYHNDVDNLEWADSPGECEPEFYEWLMREAAWARKPSFVSPATSPIWRGELDR